MSKTTAQNNRSLAEDLLAAGRTWQMQQEQQRQRLLDHPDLKLVKQIDALNRRAAAGKPDPDRKLELKRRLYDLTGGSGE